MAVHTSKVFRCILFPILMTYAGFCVCILLFPSILLIAVPSRRVIQARRIYSSLVCGMYVDYAAFLVEYLCGTTVYIHCGDRDVLQESMGALIICNHRTRIDWMFIGWCYGSALNVVNEMLIILKDALRSVPVYGWLMQLGLYIFLQRKRDSDIPHITRMLNYLIQLGTHPSLLLFPEGTDLSKSNVAKSNQYAQANGLNELTYVLHPKPSGFVAALQCMRNTGAALHDVTIAYDDHERGKRPSEKDLVTGKFPRAIYLHVERHEMKSLPEGKRELEAWLRSAFQKKEKLLKEFYEAEEGDETDTNGGEETWRDAQRNVVRNSWPQEVLRSPPANSSMVRSVLAILVVMVVCTATLYHSTISRWVCVGVIITLVSSKAFNGFDNLELGLHGEHIMGHLHHTAESHKKMK